MAPSIYPGRAYGCGPGSRPTLPRSYTAQWVKGRWCEQYLRSRHRRVTSTTNISIGMVFQGLFWGVVGAVGSRAGYASLVSYQWNGTQDVQKFRQQGGARRGMVSRRVRAL